MQLGIGHDVCVGQVSNSAEEGRWKVDEIGLGLVEGHDLVREISVTVLTLWGNCRFHGLHHMITHQNQPSTVVGRLRQRRGVRDNFCARPAAESRRCKSTGVDVAEPVSIRNVCIGSERRSLIVGLLAAAAWLAAPGQALAQENYCSVQNSVYSCSIPAGPYTSPVSVVEDIDSILQQQGMSVTNLGGINITSSSEPAGAWGLAALSATATGLYLGGASNGDTYGLSISNQGAIGLTPGTATVVDSYVFGIYVLQSAAESGSSENGVTLTNSAAIDMNLSGVQAWGGAAIWATDQGGASTGASTGASVTNSGAITATLSGQQGFAGIQAVSFGGEGGPSEQGGSAGAASIVNSAAVDVTWTWQDVGSTNNGVSGIEATSVGGNGGSNDDGGGGTGGSGGSASVTLVEGGDVTVNVSGTPPSSSAPSAGVLAAVIGGNGGAGAGDEYYSGGFGAGLTGTAQISVTDASVGTTGDMLPGLSAIMLAGEGGDGGCQEGSGCSVTGSHGGENGGYGGQVVAGTSSLITVTASSLPVLVSTTGGQSAAIQALMLGGTGGDGGDDNTVDGGTSGVGGGGGAVLGQVGVTLSGTGQNLVTASTAGDNSPGIYAASIGGDGGTGGGGQVEFFKGTASDGGSGGTGGAVNVTLTSASIATQGTSSPGIVALSDGGTGAEGGSVVGGRDGQGGGGGAGGDTGNVTVTLDSASGISTQGTEATGILAQTISGGGGNGGSVTSRGTTAGGGGGAGGTAGSVTVENDGAITTAGDTARGILVQSLAGSGGSGGTAWSPIHSSGGTGASAGVVGAVSVTNDGSIATSGSNAQGILLQSIGGSGGAGGQASGLFDSVGGNADTNPLAADGNSVTFTSDGGSIVTTGISATGVLGQSIGGGGGDGGGASGIVASVGGSGGAGGDGGTVTATLGAGTQIVTQGDSSAAVIMQSIGGGGGNAGNASSDGLFTSVAIGGSGGSGGVGGDATISADGTTIVTSGSTSAGLLVQSIGGGGGVGGQALATSVGPGVAYAVSVGGSGGDGGRAYTAAATVSGGSLIATGQGSCTSSSYCNTLPVNSYGVVVQSVGGGGGFGGSATAEAVAIAIPVSEDVEVGVAAGSAVGGTGGGGGVGGTAQFALSDGSAIVTSGQGSTAVLAQSVGGGGGVGGNASALATVIGYGDEDEGTTSLAVTATFTTGGAGGVAGNGGEVLVALGGTITADGTPSQDPAGSAATTIVTYGDYSNGVTAQSIGGGGGDAGYGSGNTQSFGTGTTTSIGVVQGSAGGSGGDGDQVEAYLFAGNGITTYGSGSVGMLAQSVGGGGGTSQGGSVSVAQSFKAGGQDYKPGLNIEMGTTGAGGGAGGDVSVTVAAAIATHGGDATGVLAQSIGGGGGLSGSAGAEASADNPIVPGLAAREGASEVANFLQNYFEGGDPSLPTVDATFSLTIGGSGGAGGIGGTVAVDLSALITTAGDWANGIVAQSIGGGGGKGGTAAASGTGGIPEITINADVALGGSGGAGGDGGDVTVHLDEGDTAIGTAGYAAAAVVAQSIGGGGGMGADGSDSAAGLISVGGSDGGSGGGGGDGQLVTLNYGNASGTHVITTGDAADGIILQSVGGGGGIAGAGSSLFIPSFLMSDKTLSLTAGGSSAVGGDGGDVTLEENYFSVDNTLDISTGGDFAFGIVAQSIGGGGGLVTVQPSAETVTTELGGTAGSGDGGTVQVFATNVTIATEGIAAHGIVAQSIGGGGGLVRVADASNDSPALTTSSDGVNLGLNQGSGSGGELVYVYAGGGGSIAVSGAGAVGILAQSIGGGGGLVIDDDSMFAGSSQVVLGDCIGTCGSGGAVTAWVDAGSTVSATGENGIGVFAQSQGYGTNGQIIVTVDGTVTGGSGTGAAGIWFDGGSSNQLKVSGTVTTVDGTDGTAVTATSGTTSGTVTITNTGTITGSIHGSTDSDAVSAASPSSVLTMDNHGTYHAGAVMQGTLFNSGVVNVGMPGEARVTSIAGDFTQTDDGQLGVTIDSLNGAVSHLKVDGSASIDGVVAPTAITLLPGSVSVVTAGNLDSTVEGLDSLVFHWDTAQSGNTLTLTPRSNFNPGGVSLTASQASLADHFARAWENADTGFATHFANLSQIVDSGSYAAALDEYSSKDIHAQSLALVNSAGAILGSSMSCPVFADRNVLLKEDDCLWLEVTGRWSEQDATGDIQGYDVSSTTYRIGAQHAIAPDLYLGGSFAYGHSSAAMDGGSSGDGDTFDGSISLKHTPGPWLFAASVALAHGAFDVNRQVNLPGFTYPLESDPSIFLGGARLRVGYQFTFGDWYARPYGDLDVVYTDLSSVEESGSPLYALDLDGSSKTNVRLSLMTEFGGRIDLDAQTTLRPYAAIGVSYLPDNTRTVDGRFASATSDNGTFTDQLETPELLGRIDLGLQLYSGSGFDVKAGYTADIGESFLSQTASARLAYRF
ncbi:autotransporter outer membrane beta-barrel domain-containing protein [Mesorhizobium sp. LHD-90]|uniref:autotransporter outer membrane beta-barrel domain-containing protein n=1 Tax=Mesorhizobium sp. LHD-90 TaxID=3071414 RepID=UPI0027E0D69D|nr:autotransporter outer membrane beta-barrel domain-containing protein [Mesorhizobium sp. LHD-90]MDQ6435232.1 autotransporter outer membrane beta-barrel domain-containing protein [Mesorhizobium sp. LHD-90]